MNPMLQRHCAKFIYIVPDGLRELMSDISREVIRTQPEQVYTFIADYLDALMITRENARIAARMVDSICEIAETTVELLLRTGLSRDAANAIVAIIQTTFREFLERKKKYAHAKEVPGEIEDEEVIIPNIMQQVNVREENLDEVAIIIQTAWHKFKDKQEREKKMLFGIVDWRIAARSAIMLYRKTGVTMYEANRAATLIKAAYKGYYTRRIMRRLLHMGLDDESTAPIESSLEERTDQDLVSEPGELDDYLQQMYSIGEDGEPDYLSFEIDESSGSTPRKQKRTAAHSKRKARSRSPRRAAAPLSDKVPSKGARASDAKTKATSKMHEAQTADKTPASATSKTKSDAGERMVMDEELPSAEEAFSQIQVSYEGEGPTETHVTEDSGEAPPPPNTEQDMISEPVEIEEIPADAEAPADVEPELPVPDEQPPDVPANEPEQEAVTDTETEEPSENADQPGTDDEDASSPTTDTTAEESEGDE